MKPRSDTLLVWTGAPCGYGCRACPITPTSGPAGASIADLQSELAALPDESGPLVVLVGGEPFLRPDLLRLMAVVRTSGRAPGVITTGRPLVYPRVRERLRRVGLAYLRVQLFGVGDAHDAAVGVPGAFAQAIEGLCAWVREAPEACDVDAVLHVGRREMAVVVRELEALARELPAPDVQLVVALDPAGCSDGQYTESVAAAAAALGEWNADTARPLLAWEGLPEATSPFSWLGVAPPRPAFLPPAPPACCLGPVAELVRARAARHRQTVANSFNFVRTDRSVPWTADSAACTAHAVADGIGPHRQLWLVDADRLSLHVTDTGDFTAAEVARVKDALGHVFVDRAAPGVLDDFTEGMRRVRPDPVCAGCEQRGRCGRRFVVVDGPPYAREEEWIAAYVAALRGRVLDVGCGEQLYRNELAPAVAGGVVDYTGLDPDALSLSRARAALPRGRFFRSTIEEFHDAPGSYGTILCLRSLNHVTDVDDALARMAALLAPGGELLIVECTPFALLRETAQVEAADRAPRGGQQHLRNLASEEVVPFARRHSLQVLFHHAATEENTNEWILLLSHAPRSALGAG